MANYHKYDAAETMARLVPAAGYGTGKSGALAATGAAVGDAFLKLSELYNKDADRQYGRADKAIETAQRDRALTQGDRQMDITQANNKSIGDYYHTQNKINQQRADQEMKSYIGLIDYVDGTGRPTQGLWGRDGRVRAVGGAVPTGKGDKEDPKLRYTASHVDKAIQNNAPFSAFSFIDDQLVVDKDYATIIAYKDALDRLKYGGNR
ncbi:MAG: hypothetical protein LBU73_05030 [Helicobacteraceae bacterium]|jgi:hypothetical protein|nr:hypothetical protein [Helicobacteraceae bacterium]